MHLSTKTLQISHEKCMFRCDNSRPLMVDNEVEETYCKTNHFSKTSKSITVWTLFGIKNYERPQSLLEREGKLSIDIERSIFSCECSTSVNILLL